MRRSVPATTGRTYPGRSGDVTHRTKRDYAVTMIREAVLTGRLQPGQRVGQDQLVRELGISPTPIREAIRLLEAEGLLRTQPHKGVTVTSLSLEELRDVYWVRVGLESIAARLAITTNPPERVAQLAERLSSLQDEMTRRFRAGQLHLVPRLNRDFHFALVEAANAQRLRTICEQMWVNLPHHYFWQRPARAAEALGQHDMIIRAVRDADAESAEAAMRAHVLWAAETLGAIEDFSALAKEGRGKR